MHGFTLDVVVLLMMIAKFRLVAANPGYFSELGEPRTPSLSIAKEYFGVFFSVLLILADRRYLQSGVMKLLAREAHKNDRNR